MPVSSVAGGIKFTSSPFMIPWYHSFINPVTNLFHHPIISYPLGGVKVKRKFINVNILEAILFFFLCLIVMVAGRSEEYAEAIGVFTVIILLPIQRNSLVTFVTGLPFDRAVKYHRWIGYILMLPLSLHGFKHGLSKGFRLFDGANRTYGSIAWISLILIWITTLPIIRRKFWEIFMGLHHVLYGMWLLFMALHETEETIKYVIAGLLGYAVDRGFRLLQGRILTNVEIQDRDGITRVTMNKLAFPYRPGQFLYINFPSISPLQWHPFSIVSSPFEGKVEVMIRTLGDFTTSLNKLTDKSVDADNSSDVVLVPSKASTSSRAPDPVPSSSEKPKLPPRRKPVNDSKKPKLPPRPPKTSGKQPKISETRRKPKPKPKTKTTLKPKPKSKSKPKSKPQSTPKSTPKSISKKSSRTPTFSTSTQKAFVDGPYGAHHLESFKVVVLQTGGIGVTPALSWLSHFCHALKKPGILDGGFKSVKKVYFIWSGRTIEQYYWFADRLDSLFAIATPDIRKKIQVSIYITRCKDTSSLPSCRWGSLKSGRPKTLDLLDTIASDNSSITSKAAFFTCGPAPLVDGCQTACFDAAKSNRSFRFYFFEETFEF